MSTSSLQRLIDDIQAAAELPLADARGLPPAVYHAREFFHYEVEHVLAHEWLVAARAEQLANPGDFLTVSVLGEPLVLVRGTDNAVRCFSNVCRHRSMQIARGCGNASRLVCPYHKWTYGLDGKLVGAPLMHDVRDFRTADVKLPEIRTELWEGFVFVNFDARAAPLGPRLASLAERIAPFRFTNQQRAASVTTPLACNWKAFVENDMECYHHLGTHEKTLEHLYPARDSWTEIGTDDYAIVRIEPSALVKRSLRSADRRRLLFPVAGKSDEELMGGILILIFPYNHIFLLSGRLSYRTFDVRGPGEIVMTNHSCVPAEHHSETIAAEVQAEMEGALEIFNEDFALLSVQAAALRSRFAAPGRLSRYEEVIWHFHRYLARRLASTAHA